MSLGVFMLCKNEQEWMAPYLLNILPFIDEVCLYDGNSTDGTLEIIKAIRDKNQFGSKIKLFENMDPKDLRDDYTRLFDECLHSLSTDLALFLHPDQWITNPDQLLKVRESSAIAMSSYMRSFAGEPGGELLEIIGRGQTWQNIFRLRNPNLQAHYHGWYGAYNEAVYFKDITGDDHAIHHSMSEYPYEVEDSGLEILHFSDVRNYGRRLSRMKTCLINQGWDKRFSPADLERKAIEHPRVSLKGDDVFKFKPARYPGEFLAAQAQYAHLCKGEKQLA